MQKSIHILLCFLLLGCDELSSSTSSSQPQAKVFKPKQSEEKADKDGGYCDKSIEEYLYHNIPLYGTQCILKTNIQSDAMKMQVFQVLQGGVLVRITSEDDKYGLDSKNAVIVTDKRYANDDYIVDAKFLYDGVWAYETVGGKEKTIDKLVEIND